MKKNVGKSDMIVRFILGAILLVLSFTDISPDELLDNLLVVAGVYLFLTGLIRYCLIYFFLGLSSYSKGKTKMY
ncbi:YgaP family membrane protein [Flavobacterium pallidum]|uniref:DUF2892 domain-containing protein n=1 Tax=Flavobacterium pallidum TaxID=2172098 RepID=A0A2S1SI58_9FLAO|nr:DUF2892 domain-containing protein [Flavobacterium pallidum]AWI26098.1 DUF2892 domain-containing protein [Flavobacterium pallidum]